jgi:Ca2+-binding EF-hand superfamily protein
MAQGGARAPGEGAGQAGSPASPNELKELFEKLDTDRSNTVDRHELVDGLHRLGINFSDTKVNEMFSIADRDHNGVIDFGEFRQFFTHLPELVRASHATATTIDEKDPDAADGFYNTTGESVEALRELFSAFDVDASSSIEFEELRDGFQKLGCNISTSSIKNMFHMADADDSGSIDFREFATFFFHLPHELQRIRAPKEEEGAAHEHSMQSHAELRSMFNTLNLDDKGTTDLSSLKEGFMKLGLNIPENKVETIFSFADGDRNGRIDFNEFVAFFFRLPQLLRHTRFAAQK